MLVSCFTYAVVLGGAHLVKGYSEDAMLSYCIFVGLPASAWIEKSNGYDVTEQFV